VRILIAEDDRVSRVLLDACLRKWGHEVQPVGDGTAALELLLRDDAPRLAIVDWMMPGIDGVEVCRRVRACPSDRPLYLILLTARAAREDIAHALGAGADDYVTKPFDPVELRARIGVGVRLVQLQQELAARVRDLEKALAHVDELHGVLPICSYCRRIRNEADSWGRLEEYVSAHFSARFSHGVCPECRKAVVEPQMEEYRRTRR